MRWWERVPVCPRCHQALIDHWHAIEAMGTEPCTVHRREQEAFDARYRQLTDEVVGYRLRETGIKVSHA